MVNIRTEHNQWGVRRGESSCGIESGDSAADKLPFLPVPGVVERGGDSGKGMPAGGPGVAPLPGGTG